VLKVRLQTPALAAELADYLEQRGFLVARRGRLEVQLALLNPVSERYDRAKTQSVLTEWECLNAEQLQGNGLELIS
jgi:hypothetical protein